MTKNKKRMGRPLIAINWELAEKLAYIQCTGEEIAATLSINYDTLERRCRTDLGMRFTEWFKKHSESGKCSLRRSLWKMATSDKPNPALAIWLSKNYLGMKDFFEQDINMRKTPSVNLIIKKKKDE